ncbi:MAG: hypothetical protein HYY24_10620 [Verrucomicrobia bacterium]|nr:hypothetical protein [Verrucomicrobiota bacterium]
MKLRAGSGPELDEPHDDIENTNLLRRLELNRWITFQLLYPRDEHQQTLDPQTRFHPEKVP